MHTRDLERFIEGLRIPQGIHAGKPFKLLAWERRFLRGAFGQPGDAALSIARGNGKSTLVAAIGLAGLVGPLVQTGGEVVIVASSFEQGLIIYRHLVSMARPWLEHPDNKGRYAVNNSTNRASIVDKRTRASVHVLGSDAKRLHGRAPVLVLADEASQFPTGSIDAMIAALETSLGKLVGSRMLWLGTRPASTGHPFAKALAGGVGYSQVHAARESDPPFRKSTWKRANPGLDDLPDLEARIRLEAGRAKRDPDRLQSFKALRLNMGTPDVVESFVYDPARWEALEGDAKAEGRMVWGVDLGTSAAQSCIACYWPDTGRLEALAAFPEIPTLADRGLADGVGPLYERCFQRGELVTLGRRVSDVTLLLREALERWGVPMGIAADRWRRDELLEKLEAGSFPPGVAVETRGQGFRDGAEDIRAFREALLTGKVTPVKSLLLRSALGEARTVSDPAGNEKLAKSSEGGRRQHARDDSIAAAILAVATGYRNALTRPAARFEYAIV